jgi:hypothetical protein
VGVGGSRAGSKGPEKRDKATSEEGLSSPKILSVDQLQTPRRAPRITPGEAPTAEPCAPPCVWRPPATVTTTEYETHSVYIYAGYLAAFLPVFFAALRLLAF